MNNDTSPNPEILFEVITPLGFSVRTTTEYWICAVTKCLNGEGFLITAYRTSAIKEGSLIWQK